MIFTEEEKNEIIVTVVEKRQKYSNFCPFYVDDNIPLGFCTNSHCRAIFPNCYPACPCDTPSSKKYVKAKFWKALE